MKKQIVALSISLSLLTLGVKAQDGHAGHKDQKMEESMKQQADPAFQKQLGAVYEASLELNEAFVASDAEKVKKAVKPVQDAVAKVDMKLLKDKGHMDWMGYLKGINNSLGQIQSSGNMADQRKHFSDFSDALYKSVKAFGIDGEPVYYQHCAMAWNNTGAYWRSDSKEIRNPYFGDKMLKCASAKEIIN